MNRTNISQAKIAQQISKVYACLPNAQVASLSNSSRLPNSHAEWLLVRARLFQAMALHFHEGRALQELQPLDKLMEAFYQPSKQNNKLRWHIRLRSSLLRLAILGFTLLKSVEGRSAVDR